jgi:hypothetical protein
MSQVLCDYYRPPADFLRDPVLFERMAGRHRRDVAHSSDNSASPRVTVGAVFPDQGVEPSLGPDQLIDYFRREYYAKRFARHSQRIVDQASVRHAYYFVRNLLPVSLRRLIQRAYLSDWKDLPFPHWPVDLTVDILHDELLRTSMKAAGTQRLPFIWFWPEGASSCLIMTHDVESMVGRDHLFALMDLDESYGLKASIQLIPEERYETPRDYIEEIRRRGFECNVHDLNHDGCLYEDYIEFLRRAKKINSHVRRIGASGFRSACMYRNQDWFQAFEFSYDMSVPNVAHLEPQRGGCCTVKPYFIGKVLELPLTTTEDYSLFHVLDTYSVDLWKQQVDLVHRRNGLISFAIHPDYLVENRPRKVFESLLDFLREKVSRERIWAALPGDVDRWWRARSQMRLIPRGNHWEIEGPEKQRARVAYAVLDGSDRLSFEV